MQPPPPAGPSGMGGPPRMGMTTNAYWRKRTPTPSAMAAPPVQPVTDPFAFGRMTPQSMAPGNAPTSNMLTMPSPSPSLYPQPGHLSAADEKSLAGAQACIPSSTPQPSAGAAMHSSVSPPLLHGSHFSNNMAPLPTMPLGLAHSAPTSLHNITGGLENASMPSQGQSQSRQSVVTEVGNGSKVSAPLQSYPPSSQQTTAPWGSTQVAPPTSSQNFPPTAQHAAYNTPHYSLPYLEVSHLPPQSSDQTYFSAPQRTAPAPFPLSGGPSHIQQQTASQLNNTIPMDYMPNLNVDQNSWFGRSYQEPQQNPPSSTTFSPGAPLPMPENRPQSESAKIPVSDINLGTVSTFFKGDEAENVEILLTEQQQNASKQASNVSYQNIGHSATLSPSQAQTAVSNTQTITSSPFHPAVTNTPLFVPQSSSGFQDPHGLWKADSIDNQPTEAKGGSEQTCDNVENMECVQNLEVLPNEPHNNIFPTCLNLEGFRYGAIPGATLPKNVPSHTEGGPNLEAPDGLSHPVRSDSVSSNYSNLSHRSLPIVTRPQELVGTFIQKESGKLENESTNSFFKQIDSSPLSKDSNVQAMGQKPFHGNLSQPPTPSPPKPTGIFQASVNSSFEPVRSYIGVKSVEVDQPKVVEVRDANQHIPNPSNNAMPAVSPGNLEQPPDNLETIFTSNANAEVFSVTSGNVFGVPPFDSLLLDKRPSSRAHGSNKKCESPATTLWAQGELPNFGGNVLLAPPAPAVYVPPKPQNEVIQPPEDGALDTQNSRPDQAQFLTMPEEQTSSENLENPPKIGDDEHPPSQASSGYASLLSSPPTESLQNQPVLIAQPNKNYNLQQPINFSLSFPNQIKNFNPAKDSSAADIAAPTGNYIPAQNASLALVQAGPPPLKMPNSLINNLPLGIDRFSDLFSNQPQNVMPVSQIPLNLVTDGQKNGVAESVAVESLKSSVPVSGSQASVGNTTGTVVAPGSTVSNHVENVGALDFTVPRVSTNQNANVHAPIQNRPCTGVSNYPNQSTNVPIFQPGLDINKQGFYQQVTKDVQVQSSLETLQPGPGPSHEYMTPVSQAPPGQVPPGSKPMTYPPQSEAPIPIAQHPADLRYSSSSELGLKYDSSEQPPYPPHPVSTSAASANPVHSVGYPEQSRPPSSQTPQQAHPYYFYGGYGTYPSAYPQPYAPVDPRASHLYYQDSYGAFDPAYRQYSNSGLVNPGKYPYQEPERPSSRSSQCSDRPSSRQGYNAPANYYADYYQSQYDYGDHSRWERYPGTYDPGYRDPRSSYWNYTYSAREDPYRKVPYGYTSRYDVYEDRWQYDPRYVGGFDDEIDARRDLAKDDFDRRSVHSEHSARSIHSERSTHSRRSSFSSRSQQSQVYKTDQDLTENVYASQIANPALGDYSYNMYPNDYSKQQPPDSFQYGYSGGSEWQPVEQVPSRPLTPEKFGSPHVCARFGPGGHLIKVLPNLPSDGQPTLVEIHNMEIIMQSCPEQEQMRTFPGPLVKDETHKVDVINFAQNKAKECTQNENLIDQESARLLWDFIVLLCRQNGTVVGTDIAELLLQDHKTVWLPGKSPNEANLIDFNNEPLEHEEESGASQLSFLTDTLPISGAIMEKETERFRELLLYGRKKDALESAMKHGLWGHALLLASKMDSRTHARVMTRFANSLPINDPLQTVYQLLSGRMPAAATCCGDEKWGDWRPHLAMVLSNITNNVDVPTRTMTTMGDTLASRGLLDAAHFCYIMAQVGFGVFTKKTTKLVLIGSNHSSSFAKFATNEAIQRTEAYEYAHSLGAQTIYLPNIQVYKFVYACRLAENGLSAQAFHYCEVIAKTVLRHPSYYSPVLVSQLLEVSSHLRFCDPQLKEKPEQELFVEPSWLVRLRHLDIQMKQGTVIYNTGRTTPQQYACSTPSSDQDHISQSDGMIAAHDMHPSTDNPLLANLLPNMIPPVQGVQLALPGPEHTAVYQPPPVGEPFYSATQQTFVPPPGLSPPVSGPGFGAFNSDPVPAYTPATMDPAPAPPQSTEIASQEQWNQDPTVQRPPQNSPTKTTFHDAGFDFYGEMAKMAPGQRSRTVSQSSSHMRRTRTTSESSTHSIGSTRRSSIGIQPSPPPPAIPESERSEPKKEPKANPSLGGSRSWFPLKIGWLMGKGKNEAHLPDDRNKSIVWDEKKQRWVNLDEPEGEESKPLPPPPSSMPKRPQASSSGPGGPGAPPNPSVNMFSIRAGGARGRYVDVLNPGGSKPATSVPPPADLFAPLAPMPIPSNFFVPNSVPEESQPSLGSDAETVQPPDQPGLENPAQTQFLSTALGSDLPPSNSDDYPSGEASSSIAPPSGPVGTVPFYNPSSFAQQSPAGGSAARPGRLGQRKYPALK